MKKWEVYDSNTIAKNEWITVKCDKCVTESGIEISDYYWIDALDFVVVFGMTENREIVIVEQYRHGAREVLLELPGGIIDEGEEPLEAAKRELIEETGYSSDEFMLKKVLYQAPSSVNSKGYVFYAKKLVKLSNQNLDDTENINVKLIDVCDLEQMLEGDSFNGTFTLSTVLLALRDMEWFNN